MKKILVAVLIAPLIYIGMVYAQEQQQFKIPCGDTKTMFSQLRTEHGEEPFIYGKEFVYPTDAMSIWVNPKNLSWSILLTRGNKTCLIGTGTNFTIANYGKPT
jgi:hypothetical protein